MNKNLNLMKTIVVLLFVSSFSLILSFFGDYSGNAFNVIMAYAVGVLFWLGLIVGYILFFSLNKRRKKDKKFVYKFKSRPGIFVFFSNKYAFVIDIAMIAMLIFTVIFSFIPLMNYSLSVVSASILLFLIHMHCLLNGVNFKYILSITKERKSNV